MSWTGQIARTERRGDRLDIIVHYSDGDNEYDQTISTTGIQGDNWLSDQITDKLNQLNTLDAYEQLVSDDNLIDSNINIDANTGELILQASIGKI